MNIGFVVKKLLVSLAVPPLVLLVAAALGLLLCRRRPRLGHALVASALLAMLALSLPWVANALVRSLESGVPIAPPSLARAGAIVVLGAGIYPQAPEFGGADTVARNSLGRARYAALLQRRSGLPLLTSGGSPYGGVAEAEAMRELLEREFMVPVRWTETASHDTAENAQYSGRILAAAGVSSVALVTDAWHMPRARLEFQRAGIAVMPAPTGFAVDSTGIDLWLPSSFALNQSGNACREWLALLWARWRD